MMDGGYLKRITHEEVKSLKEYWNKWQIDVKDSDSTYWWGMFVDGKLVGVSGFKVGNNYIRFKVILIIDEYHRMGLGEILFAYTERQMDLFVNENPAIRYYSCFATDMSESLFAKFGYNKLSHHYKHYDNKDWYVAYMRKDFHQN